MDNIPCRVMGDLARHEADMRDAEPERFDEYNEMHIKAIAPYRLADAIQQLLLTRLQINIAAKTFGADPVKVSQAVIEDLDRLYSACIDQWNDL